MAYVTAAQFLRLVDRRRVRDLLSDSGTPVADADLADNENLADILGVASEMIASAALVGERYTPEQLAALAASATGGYLLRSLTAHLAYGLLVSRRGQGAADVSRQAPMYVEALRQLDQLRTGAALFPGVPNDDHPDAGLPATANLNATTQTARVSTVAAQAGRLFPFSCDRVLPPNSGNCC